MNMQNKLYTASLLTCAASLLNCETVDPRVATLPGSEPVTEGPGEDDSPRGLGELCGEETPNCNEALSCYEGTCIPAPYAEACTPNPCGDNGVCNARGNTDEDGNIDEDDILLVCRCTAANEEWDGTTCRESEAESGFPKFSDTVLEKDETCPGPEAQLGIAGATECPEGTFCDASGEGRCLEFNFSVVGALADQSIDVSSTGEEATTVECIREYFDAAEPEEGEDPPSPSGTSNGVKLVITGALAEQISPGAPSVTIALSNGDVLGGLPLLVVPQPNAPEPREDSIFASLSLDEAELLALGGQVTLDSVSGPDENEDNLIDDNEGAIGGTFFIGLPEEQFLAGSFVIPCGANETVPLPDEE